MTSGSRGIFQPPCPCKGQYLHMRYKLLENATLRQRVWTVTRFVNGRAFLALTQRLSQSHAVEWKSKFASNTWRWLRVGCALVGSWRPTIVAVLKRCRLKCPLSTANHNPELPLRATVSTSEMELTGTMARRKREIARNKKLMIKPGQGLIVLRPCKFTQKSLLREANIPIHL